MNLKGMKRKLLAGKMGLLAISALSFTSAMAQMSVSLLDDDAVTDPKQWEAAAPIIQAGLECRELINSDVPALRPLFARNTSQWEFVPPKGFTVFGMPVHSITIYIDPDGEMGASYTASVAAPEALASKAAQANGHHEDNVGSLMTAPGSRPSSTDITCTVAGSWEADDNE